MAATRIDWDEETLEGRLALCNKLQISLVGAAIMALMMEITTAWLTGPLALAFLLVSLLRFRIVRWCNAYEDAYIELAPRSLVLSTPNQQATEERILYRQISHLEPARFWGLDGLRVRLTDGRTLEWPALYAYADLQAALQNAAGEQSTAGT